LILSFKFLHACKYDGQKSDHRSTENGNYIRINENPPGNSKSGITVQDGITVRPEGVSSTNIVASLAEEVKSIEDISKNYGEKAAGVAKEHYDGGDEADYAEYTAMAYEAGREGVSLDSIEDRDFNDFRKTLPEAIEAMYKAGKEAAKEGSRGKERNGGLNERTEESAGNSVLSNEEKYDTIKNVRESISNLYPNASEGDIENAAEGITEIQNAINKSGSLRTRISVREAHTGAGLQQGPKSGIKRRNRTVSGNHGRVAQSVDNSGIRTIALGITDEFVNHGYIDFTGRKLSRDTNTMVKKVTIVQHKKV